MVEDYQLHHLVEDEQFLIGFVDICVYMEKPHHVKALHKYQRLELMASVICKSDCDHYK